MSVKNKLYAGEIDCFVSKLENGLRWLRLFARDALPNVTHDKQPWYFIVNTDPKDLRGTHWLDYYAP